MRRTIALIAVILVVSLSSSAQTIKVACIGDSCSYPAQLQLLLGSTYDVRDFGHSGATLIRKSFRPYNTLPEYQAALAFVPDMVVINLGINDTDPRIWPNYSEDFIPDYHALMDNFKKINPKVKVRICLMTPISHTHKRFLSGTRDFHLQVQNAIRQIAETTPGVGLIDLYSPLFVRPDLFPDGLHPDAEGAGIREKHLPSWYEAAKCYRRRASDMPGNHSRRMQISIMAQECLALPSRLPYPTNILPLKKIDNNGGNSFCFR